MISRRPLALIAACVLTVSASAQMPIVPPPINLQGNGGNGPNVIAEPAKPVIIDGKRASDLSEDELTEFLQSKIQTIEQGDGDLVLLRIAPGYALTITFEEPVTTVIMGDPTLAAYERAGKTVILTAKQRAGDTNLKIQFNGGVLREYHIFIEPNYSHAQSTIRVVTPKSHATGGNDTGSQYISADGEFNVPTIARVVLNYDALVKEKSIDTTHIKRQDVFRQAASGEFTYYSVFTFPGGVKAISFSCRGNNVDASRLRLQVGEIAFRPDYVSFERTGTKSNGTTMGMLLFNNPGFALTQPFEITK